MSRYAMRRAAVCVAACLLTFSARAEDDARAWIAKRGYDPKMGARPMARVIQEHIKRPLAEELLFGQLEKGGHAFVSVGTDEQLKIETRSSEEPALLE